MAWDVTVVNRVAPSHLTVGLNEGPVVANNAETRKRSHYSSLDKLRDACAHASGGYARVVLIICSTQTLGWAWHKFYRASITEKDEKWFAYGHA